MAHFTTLTVIFTCLYVSSSLSRWNTYDLEEAVSAFDELANDPTNNADDKIEPVTISVEAEASTRKPDVIEEVFIKKEAPCLGCVEVLDVLSADVIKAAEHALNCISDGNEYTYVRLINATRQVVNGFIYNYAVEANRVLNGVSDKVACDLEFYEQIGHGGKTVRTHKCCQLDSFD